jgi:polysaccharide deacetylase
MRLRDLTILQYQNVTEDAHLHRLWLSLGAFKKQMAHLKENNFQVLSIAEAIGYMEGRIKTDGKRTVALTFDNGFMDFYEQVLPVLTEYGYPATVLVSPDKVGTVADIGEKSVQYLTWNTLKQLPNPKITIGTYEDAALNINSIPVDSVREHISTYREKMENRLGIKIEYHGIKEGVPEDKVRDLLIEKGYRAFLTQCPTKQKTDLYAIGRIQVDDEDLNIFLSKISATYLFFKDKESWKYIRKYHLDKLVHRVSEAYNRLRDK